MEQKMNLRLQNGRYTHSDETSGINGPLAIILMGIIGIIMGDSLHLSPVSAVLGPSRCVNYEPKGQPVGLEVSSLRSSRRHLETVIHACEMPRNYLICPLTSVIDQFESFLPVTSQQELAARKPEARGVRRPSMDSIKCGGES